MRWVYLLVAVAYCVRAATETAPNVPHATAAAQQTSVATRVANLRTHAAQKETAGDYRSAISILEQARSLCVPSDGCAPEVYASVLASIADDWVAVSDWDRAISFLNEAVTTDQLAFGAADPRTAAIEVRLAAAETAVGSFAEAEPLLRRAIAVQRSASATNRFELAISLSALATLYVDLKRLPDAEHAASEAVSFAEPLHVRNAEYASMLCTLGVVYMTEGKNARALPLLNRALDVIRETSSPDNVRAAPIFEHRGMLESTEGKFALAEQDLRHAIAILDGASASPNVNGDWARFRLAHVLMRDQKLSEADEILSSVVERQRTFFSGPSKVLAIEIVELARLRQMQKHFDQAATLYREAIAMSSSTASGPAIATSEQGHPAKEKDVRRLAQQASGIFGFRAAE